MQTLRWILGVVTALCSLGFLAILIFGEGFRRSFGASGNSVLKIALIVAIQILLLLSLTVPNQWGLMHITAAVVVALVVGCLWTYRESAFVGTSGLIYCIIWFVYYKLAIAGTQ